MQSNKSGNHMSGKTLEESLVERITNWINQTASLSVLPSMADLCRKFDTSRSTMIRVANTLRARRIVEFRRGQRMRVTGRFKIVESLSMRPSEALYQVLAHGIQDGDYLVGQPLPKPGFVAAKNNVSVNTVRRVYQRLVENDLASRNGAATVPGLPLIRKRGAERFVPTIVIVAGRPQLWESLCKSSRTDAFGRAFLDEAHRAQVRVVVACSTRKGPLPRSIAPVAQGLSETMAFIKSLGPSYLGTLLVSSLREMPGLIDEWVRALRRFDRAVVWLDRFNEGDPHRAAGSGVIRCHAREDNAVMEALAYSRQWGHQCVEMVVARNGDWQRRRAAILLDAARSANLPMEAGVSVVHEDRDWASPSQTGIRALLEELKQGCSSVTAEAIRQLADANNQLLITCRDRAEPQSDGWTLSGFCAMSNQCFEMKIDPPKSLSVSARRVWSAVPLVPCARRGTVTMIFAPNDQQAQNFHLDWLDRLGLQAPKNVSILSFDNENRFAYDPLASVDFGYGYLGYQAYHVIAGDIPVAVNGHGGIAARASVRAGGTVGVPGRPMRLSDL